MRLHSPLDIEGVGLDEVVNILLHVNDAPAAKADLSAGLAGGLDALMETFPNDSHFLVVLPARGIATLQRISVKAAEPCA